jgi:RNA polymerase sigma factor (TIGR02999 family)
MSIARDEAVTALLQAAGNGSSEALDELFRRLYDELHALARTVRRGRAGATLNTTALVHEAYLKLLPPGGLSLQDRTHFLRVAARAMRQVLVDTARSRMAQKRGGDQLRVSLDDDVHGASISAEEVLGLDDALSRLGRLDERQAQIIEFRIFAGLSVEETAAALNLSVPTVYRDWRAARAWLARELNPS